MHSSASVVFAGPASPQLTLSPLRRGRADPCYHDAADGAIWRTSLMRSGPVTARICRSAPDTVDCEAWGPGAAEFTETLPALLGADDDASGFQPTDPTIAAARRRVPHLRLGRTGRVLEALMPAVLEQRVLRHRRAPRVAKAGDQIRRARARPGSRSHAGAADGRGVAAHPVVGVPPRQRRPGPGPHHRGLRAARRRAGEAGQPLRRGGTSAP